MTGVASPTALPERLTAVTSWPRDRASAAMREPTMPVAPKRRMRMRFFFLWYVESCYVEFVDWG